MVQVTYALYSNEWKKPEAKTRPQKQYTVSSEEILTPIVDISWKTDDNNPPLNYILTSTIDTRSISKC